MGVNHLLDVSRRSLGTYQNALSVTAHNVANGQNDKYTRQRVTFAAEAPVQVGLYSLGSGVTIGTIDRVKDEMIETHLRRFNQGRYNYEKQDQIYNSLEVLLSEPSELGLSSFITSFFNSWNELSVNPKSVAYRNNVINQAQLLANRFNEVYEGFNRVREGLFAETGSYVAQINTLAKQINTYNQQIYEGRVRGSNINDLMDNRDNAINELSKVANINVTFDNNNTAYVSLGGFMLTD